MQIVSDDDDDDNNNNNNNEEMILIIGTNLIILEFETENLAQR